MKLKIDVNADALYFRLDDSEIIESEEVSSGIILDFNQEGKIIGIEILKLSERSNKINLKNFHLEYAETAFT